MSSPLSLALIPHVLPASAGGTRCRPEPPLWSSNPRYFGDSSGSHLRPFSPVVVDTRSVDVVMTVPPSIFDDSPSSVPSWTTGPHLFPSLDHQPRDLCLGGPSFTPPSIPPADRPLPPGPTAPSLGGEDLQDSTPTEGLPWSLGAPVCPGAGFRDERRTRTHVSTRTTSHPLLGGVEESGPGRLPLALSHQPVRGVTRETQREVSPGFFGKVVATDRLGRVLDVPKGLVHTDPTPSLHSGIGEEGGVTAGVSGRTIDGNRGGGRGPWGSDRYSHPLSPSCSSVGGRPRGSQKEPLDNTTGLSFPGGETRRGGPSVLPEVLPSYLRPLSQDDPVRERLRLRGVSEYK